MTVPVKRAESVKLFVIIKIQNKFSYLLEGQSEHLKGPNGVEFISNKSAYTISIIEREREREVYSVISEAQ